MGIEEQLQSRAFMFEALAALEFNNDAPLVLAAMNQRELLHPANIAVLELCLGKWRTGARLATTDLSDVTVDRVLFLKTLCALFVPLIRTRHAELGLPTAVTDETCRGIGTGVFVALREYPDELVQKLSWAGRYCREIMFKAGLFVYHLTAISEKLPVLAFRERATGRITALAADGMAVDGRGLICQDDQPGQFVTRLLRSGTEITGNVITPYGRISGNTKNLSLDDWETILAPGMLTGEIHIPPGRGMLPDDCRDSLRWATQIIQQHFGDRGARCLTCRSWILSPDWPELLPDSNLAKFMREVYLFPIKAPPTIGVNFVFRKRVEELDLKTAPRKSRLQRIMLERLEKQQPLYGGGMFMPFEDVGKYGTHCYQAGSESRPRCNV